MHPKKNFGIQFCAREFLSKKKNILNNPTDVTILYIAHHLYPRPVLYNTCIYLNNFTIDYSIFQKTTSSGQIHIYFFYRGRRKYK